MCGVQITTTAQAAGISGVDCPRMHSRQYGAWMLVTGEDLKHCTVHGGQHTEGLKSNKIFMHIQIGLL